FEAYDKKSGRVVCEENINPGQFYLMNVDPKEQSIELIRHDVKVRFVPEGTEPRGAGKPAAAAEPGVTPPVALPVQRGQIRMVPAQGIQLKVAPAVIPPPPPLPAPPKEAKPADKKGDKP